MLRILLADRLASARGATKLFLSRHAEEWQVVAEAEDAASLFGRVTTQSPDVVIMHTGVLELSLVETLSALHTICPSLKIIVSSGDAAQETAVLAAGADAFLYLGDPPAKLITKLRIIQLDQN